MVRVIVSKEEKVEAEFLSYKEVRGFRKKGFRYYFFILRRKLKGFKIEIVDERCR